MQRFFLAFLLLLAQSARADSISSTHLPGTWQGEGRFYEVKMLSRTEPPAFDLTIASDLTLTGTIGSARIAPARPCTVRNHIEYRVLLDGPSGPGKLLAKKNHLVILITAVDETSLSADFHLKSRFGFDPSMRPGSLEAVRATYDGSNRRQQQQ